MAETETNFLPFCEIFLQNGGWFHGGWFLLASMVLLLIGCLANLFSLVAVKNAAKDDVNRPHKAFIRHTNYLQHASDASLNFLTIFLIPCSHSRSPAHLASHIQAVPVAVVVWVHLLRSISQTASLVGPFPCFKLTSVYRETMVGMAYFSCFLVAFYAFIFNFNVSQQRLNISHGYQDEMVWMMAVQGWILPGVILFVSNVIYLVQIWLNERENRKTGMVVRYGWKLWIAVYGFLITFLFMGATTGSILVHPLHQKLLLQEEVAIKIPPSHAGRLERCDLFLSIFLPATLSLLNPLLQAICLEKYRGDCADLLNLLKGNSPEQVLVPAQELRILGPCHPRILLS